MKVLGSSDDFLKPRSSSLCHLALVWASASASAMPQTGELASLHCNLFHVG